METQKIIERIITDLIALEEITATGLTGKLPQDLQPGESDIDIFVFCRKIPLDDQRRRVYEKFVTSSLIRNLKMNVSQGGVWGIGDCFWVNGVETWLMYFCETEVEEYLDAVLSGDYLDSEQGFYPTGRCATIQHMVNLQDKSGFIDSLKQKVQVYPESLRNRLAAHHLDLSVDEEDFGRAVLRRDVLFYHQVLEAALDHFLQALFAVNRRYFPGRKRTLQYIDGFEAAPALCGARLLKAVELGTKNDGITESSRIWHELVQELSALYYESEAPER